MKYKEHLFELIEDQPQNPVKRNLEAIARSKTPWADEVLSKSEKCHRAIKASPLLEEYMNKNKS